MALRIVGGGEREYIRPVVQKWWLDTTDRGVLTYYLTNNYVPLTFDDRTIDNVVYVLGKSFVLFADFVRSRLRRDGRVEIGLENLPRPNARIGNHSSFSSAKMNAVGFDKLGNARPPLIPKSSPIIADYTISDKVLGLGINGKVVECFDKKTGLKYALKVILFFF